MRIEGPETPTTMRLLETFMISGGFKCACCETIYDTREMGAYLTEYKARDPIMKKAVPKQNSAAYIICVECARLPEKHVFLKAQEHCVKNGLLQTGHKPIDQSGRHTPKRRPMITQNTKFRFGEGR